MKYKSFSISFIFVSYKKKTIQKKQQGVHGKWKHSQFYFS